MTGVYISIPVWRKGMCHSQDVVMSFAQYFQEELIDRAINLSLDPFNADIIFFLPTWQQYQECKEEYEYFKRVHNKPFAYSIEQVVEFYRSRRDE